MADIQNATTQQQPHLLCFSLICEDRETGRKCQFKGIKAAVVDIVSQNNFLFGDLLIRNICLNYFLEKSMVFLPTEDHVDVMLGICPSEQINEQVISLTDSNGKDDNGQKIIRIKFEKIRPAVCQQQQQHPSSEIQQQLLLDQSKDKVALLIDQQEEQFIRELQEGEQDINLSLKQSEDENQLKLVENQSEPKIEVKEEDTFTTEEELKQSPSTDNDENISSNVKEESDKGQAQHSSSTAAAVKYNKSARQEGSLIREEENSDSLLNKKRKLHEILVDQDQNNSDSRSHRSNSSNSGYNSEQPQVDFSSPKKRNRSEAAATSPTKIRIANDSSKTNDTSGTFIPFASMVVPLDTSLSGFPHLLATQLSQQQQQQQLNSSPLVSSGPSILCRQSRNKERTIKEAIDMVTRWRDLQEDYRQKHQVKGLQEVADELNISKKVLDYYFQELRTAEFFGFDFNGNLKNKMGVLRKFIEEQKKNHEDKNKNFKITRNLQFRYRLRDYSPGSTYKQTNADKLLQSQLQQQQQQPQHISEESPPPRQAKAHKDSKISQKNQAKLDQLNSFQKQQQENFIASQFQDVLLKNSPIFLHFLNTNNLASVVATAGASSQTSLSTPTTASNPSPFQNAMTGSQRSQQSLPVDQTNSIQKALMLLELFSKTPATNVDANSVTECEKQGLIQQNPQNPFEDILLKLLNPQNCEETTTSSSLLSLQSQQSLQAHIHADRPPLLIKSYSANDSRKSFTRPLKQSEIIQVNNKHDE